MAMPTVRAIAAAAALGAMSCGFLPGSAQAADPVGQVSEARGRATGLLGGVARELAAGAAVYLAETLRTADAARLSLQFGERTRLQVGERTQVRIDTAIVEHGGVLVLERGALMFDRNDAEEGSLTVRTPFGTVATRGTRFFVGPSRGAMGVFCARGRVAVRTDAGEVELGAGEGTNLMGADEPPSPKVRWNPGRVAEAMASVN